MTYPTHAKRAADAERYPARVGPVRALGRRRLRAAIMPLLGRFQKGRRATFESLDLLPGRVLFLGDSITEGGVWNELVPDVPVLNRGISGDTTAQLLARLDTAVNAPLAVFLLIGTNDISSGVPTAEIVGNVRRLLTELDRRSPGTPVVVQSIMPRKLAYRDEVRYVNRLLQGVVANAGPQVTYLDLWPALATPEGALRPELTNDNLHLNGQGYQAWAAVLRPVVDRLTQQES